MKSGKHEEEVTQIIQRDAASLAAGYLGWWRVMEILSVAAFLTLSGIIVFKLSAHAAQASSLFVLSIILGQVSADFVSGFVHWLGDTWGDADWPIVGPTLIRTFREHHVDQKAITRHDFIETNGMNCMISLPVLIIGAVTPTASGNPVTLFLLSWGLSLTLWVFATNQIHKWAHQDSNASWITFLQKTRIILSPGHHTIHHSAPYEKYYCITTGWLNAPLTKMGFFRKSEALITQLTGAIPRKDDIGLDAALTTLTSEAADSSDSRSDKKSSASAPPSESQPPRPVRNAA